MNVFPSAESSPTAPTLRFHANPETDSLLAKAIANAPAPILETLQGLHIPSLSEVFASFHRLDRAQHLQDELDDARRAKAGRGAAGRAKSFSADERKAMRAEIRQLRNDAQLPNPPKPFPPRLEAKRQEALHALYQRYCCIVRRSAAPNRGLCPSVESNSTVRA